MSGVSSLLKANGIFAFEFSYIVDVIEKHLFDTIYHEHLDYHSVTPLVKFFAKHGFKVISSKRVDTHGGSVRMVVQKNDGNLQDDGRAYYAFLGGYRVFDFWKKFSSSRSL